MTTTITVITDTYGNVNPDHDYEPNPGSVVLTDGEWGTGWQLHFADGLWHPMRGGSPRPWAYLLQRRNLVLVYAARERLDSTGLTIHGVKTGRMHSAPSNVDDAILREVERKAQTVHTWATGRGN